MIPSLPPSAGILRPSSRRRGFSHSFFGSVPLPTGVQLCCGDRCSGSNSFGLLFRETSRRIVRFDKDRYGPCRVIDRDRAVIVKSGYVLSVLANCSITVQAPFTFQTHAYIHAGSGVFGEHTSDTPET